MSSRRQPTSTFENREKLASTRSFAGAFWRTAACLICLLSALSSAAGQPAEASKLTPQQQERLKERDRYAKETQKLRSQGKPVEAIAACQKKLAIEREIFGSFHEDIAGSLELLAEMHEEREEFADARKAREEVLQIQRGLHPAQDWRVSDARRHLRDLERLARLDADSRQQLRRAAELYQGVESLYEQGRYHEALPQAKHSVAIRQKILGQNHLDLADSLSYLAQLYRVLGDYTKALPLFEQAREVARNLLGENHPEYANSLNN